METILGVIFGLGCGVLYVVGLCFGYDYWEFSVIVAFKVYPTLFSLSTFALMTTLIYSLFRFENKRLLKITSLPFAIYAFVLSVYFQYCLYIHYFSPPTRTIRVMFDMCLHELQAMAASCHTTYAVVNCMVYLIYPALIVIPCWWLAYRLMKKK